MKKTRIVFLAALLLLSACGGAKELPAPGELYALLEKEAGLPAMADMPGEYLLDNTGISPEQYDAMVCRVLLDGLGPDELAIVRAKDAAAAEDIEARLEKRLAAKERDAQNYLTEYMPVIREGVVRRDGLTVSLLVSAHIDGILAVYGRYK